MRRRGIGRPAQPSLVNTAARTAVVVGTATAVSGKAASNQAAKAQQSGPATAATRPAAATPRLHLRQPPVSAGLVRRRLRPAQEAGRTPRGRHPDRRRVPSEEDPDPGTLIGDSCSEHPPVSEQESLEYGDAGGASERQQCETQAAPPATTPLAATRRQRAVQEVPLR